MDHVLFDRLTLRLGRLVSRRATIGGCGASGLAMALGRSAFDSEAKKKHKKKRRKHKHKGKKKCGKAGAKPVKGKCCAGSVAVDGVCQRCDVCESGCDFSSVQAAIDSASPGASITICPGTYRFQNYAISQDVRLIGAGDGQGAGDTVMEGTGEGSVVTISGGVVALEHLRITGGGAAYGGGISHAAGTLTLTECTVSGNRANIGGGGIDSGGTLIVTGSKISGNTADFDGGGIMHLQGNLSLVASEVSGNTAGSSGGGLYNGTLATATLDVNSRVTGNTADTDGGGVYNGNGTVTLASSENVTDNTPNNCAGPTAVAQCSG